MPFVTANGILLHTSEIGSGPPVVLVHGVIIGNLATWYFTVAPLLAATSRVIMYDLRGHGFSEQVPRGYDLRTMSQDLSALVGLGSPGPVTLIGHSYGGLIALRFALDHPSRVERVALVDAPFPPTQMNEFQDFLEQPFEGMVDALPLPLRRFIQGGGRQANRMKRSLEFLAGRTTLLADMSIEAEFDREELSSFPGEVLCVYGESSRCREGGQLLASLLPRSRFVVLPGGHYLPVESPAPLAECLVEFVRV